MGPVLKDKLKDKRIILVGGAGGVGKTTLAACLGTQLAKEGYRTVVLTVDPAKRLAQALGLDALHSDLQKVEIPGHPEAHLQASMLDAQRYFDKIIEKFAKSESQKKAVLEHPIYRTMVESLGGTQEYAAMERLLEFVENSECDKIVVDTPPTQNAVDLLTAPSRLAEFMDNKVFKWFQGRKPMYLQIFQQGTKLAMKLMEKIFGTNFLDSFGNLMDSFDGMQEGFRNRNLQVLELMRSPQTAFLLVSRSTETRYMETVSFLQALDEQGISLTAILLNRMELSCPESSSSDPKLQALLEFYRALYQQEHYWAEKSKALDKPLFLIPRSDQALHTVEALSQLGNSLLTLNSVKP